MTRQNAGWVVAGVVALLAVAIGAAAPESQVGRFQIIQVERTIATEDGRSSTVKAAMLLDTVAGKSWEAGMVVGNDEVWIPMRLVNEQ